MSRNNKRYREDSHKGPQKKIYFKVKKRYQEILNGNGKLIVEISEEIGKKISPLEGGEVTMNQVRKVFRDLKRIQYKGYNTNKVQLLRPKLAYTQARHKKRGMDLLIDTMDFLIEKVNSEEMFNNIVDLFEGILAYHKKYGGK